MRIHPITKEEKMHYGTDFSAPEGTPIHSIDDGVVSKSGAESKDLTKGFGYRVTIGTNYGRAVYGHMNEHPLVNVGDKVQKGDLLGYVGNTGTGTGNHLHYEKRGKNHELIMPTKEDLKSLLDDLNQHCPEKI